MEERGSKAAGSRIGQSETGNLIIFTSKKKKSYETGRTIILFLGIIILSPILEMRKIAKELEGSALELVIDLRFTPRPLGLRASRG